MRGLILAAVMGATVSAAQAADMPDLPILRGSVSEGLSKTTRSWDGNYAGGTFGYTTDASDFSQSVTGLTNYIFRDSVLQQPTANWSLLSKNTAQSTSFGGFVGRNWQWYDAVLGLEGTYTYFQNLTSSVKGSNSLVIINPPGDVVPAGATNYWGVTLTGAAAATVKDMVTLRARAGWDGGDFMPYVFGGAAVGRMDISRTVTSNVTYRQDRTVTDAFGNTTFVPGTTSAVPAQSQTQGQQKTNAFVVGWTAGLGVEYCLFEGLFARVEYEYVHFSPFMNTQVTLNNARVGLGYKF
jgi:outer membrane immunogenic protein